MPFSSVAFVIIALLLGDLISAAGTIQNVTIGFANKQTIVYYDTTLPNPIFILTRETNDAIYLIAVPNTFETTVRGVFCKTTFATQVLIGPKGCDQSENPSLAVEAYNCAEDDQTALRNKVILESTFWMEYGTSVCSANGGDRTTCLGPLYVIRANSMLPIDNRDITAQDILTGQGVALITGFGTRCEGPAVTWLDIELPSIRVNTSTCRDSFNISFQGIYQPYYQDASTLQQNMTANLTQVYARQVTGTHQRLGLLRVDDQFVIILYTMSQAGIAHQSILLVQPDTWLNTIPISIQFNTGCNVTLDLVYANNDTAGSPTSYLLNPPQEVDDLTYALNKFPPRFYQTAECNRFIGMLDENLNLKYPHLREGEVGGGELIFKTPGVTGKPIYVAPDSNFADYDVDSCDSFYPPAKPFAGYGLDGTGTNDTYYEPYIASSGLCFAPFLDVDYIQQRQGVAQARYVDCFKQGGSVYGATREYCFRPIQKTWCKTGSIYFHQHCYKKFDLLRDSKYLSADLDADDMCKRWHPFASTIKRMTRDEELFLSKRFVFWKRQNGSVHRVNYGGKRCVGFDIQQNDTTSDSDQASMFDLNCDTVPAFPICRYHIKDVPIPYSEFLLSPNTIRTLRDGQPGVPHVGRELQCKCQPGWAPPACAAGTCVPPLTEGNSSLLQFFGRCYANARGTCENMNPRLCKCFEGYGPSASWTSGNHTDHPCACPAVESTDPASLLVNGYVINNVLYESTTTLVCGGIDRGACQVESSLNLGICQCNTRTNMDPDALVQREPAWDSAFCSTPVAMIPANQRFLNGDFPQGICTGRGTACPSGERLSEQRLDEVYLTLIGRDVCQNRDRTLKSGCVCDDGYAGDACTCPIPKNILQAGLFPSLTPYQAYAVLKTRGVVDRVMNADPKTCNITRVWIQDRPSSPTLDCTLTVDLTTRLPVYACPSTIPVTKVFLETADTNVLFCDLKAFEHNYPPCGNHPLVRAGAFFRNEVYRSFTKYELPQSSSWAPHGCTWTECMCAAGYTGQLCSYGVSAVRYDWELQGVHLEVCGGVTLPTRGQPLSNGRGCQCYKIEGILANGKFTGGACESILTLNPNGTILWAVVTKHEG